MGDNTSEIIVLVVLFLLFLVGREFICWYFKINRRMDLLEEILEELKKKP